VKEKLISEELQEAVDSAIACFEESMKLMALSEQAKKRAVKIVDKRLYTGNWLSSDKTAVLQCEDGVSTIIYLDDPTDEDEDDND